MFSKITSVDLLSKSKNLCLLPLSASRKNYSKETYDVSNLALNSGALALKRGTGGRSSFSGTVVTVFGSSGLIGHSVVNQLGKIGSQIIIPYRGDHYKVKHHKLSGDLGQILYYPFYLRDEESIYKAVKYSNVVINLIGKDNETPSFLYDEVNVDGARAIARACREAGVQRLIHLSALNIAPEFKGNYVKGGSGFLKSKYYGEIAVREEFPEAIIFRPADVFGSDDRFILYWTSFARRSRWNMFMYKKGRGVYKQPVYLSDIGKGIVNAIYDPEVTGKTIDAVGPKRYELREIVDYLRRIVQRDESYGFNVRDSQYRFGFRFKIMLMDAYRRYPSFGVCMDRLERETISDMKTPGNLTLEDLGVTLQPIETIAKFELKLIRRMNYYDDEVGEWDEPFPPKTVPAL